MKEEKVRLIAYKREIEVLSLSMVVPSYEYGDERRNYFPKYEDVLLKLFNNMREEHDILKIRNFYGSDRITIEVNLTDYITNETKEEAIKHLTQWFKCGCDVADEDVTVHLEKGCIYSVPQYDNNMSTNKDGEYLENYLDLEDF